MIEQDIRNYRTAICIKCSNYTEFPYKMCKKCLCPINKKVKKNISECPLKLWDK